MKLISGLAGIALFLPLWSALSAVGTTATEEADRCLRRGIEAVSNSSCQEAIAEFNHAARLGLTNALLHEYRGIAFLLCGKTNEALADFTVAHQMSPTNSGPLFNRAGVYRQIGEIDLALADLTQVLRLNPRDPLAYKSRAALYAVRRDFKAEIADWTEGLKLSPNDSTALALRGFAYANAGRFADAVEDYKRAITLNATNDVAWNNYAWLRATCSDKSFRNGTEAVKAATRACELTGWARWDWIDTLAASYAEMGDDAKAVEFQGRAIAICEVKGDRTEMETRLAEYRTRAQKKAKQKE